jgi:hypothetical protein
MIHVEPIIESALRIAMRRSIAAASQSVPELATAKVICFWLQAEDGFDNEAEGLRVMVNAQPNSSGGYNPSSGFQALRDCRVDIACISQPDSDKDRAIAAALYVAVRAVFEDHTTTAPQFVIGDGVSFGGMLIDGGGSGEIAGTGEVVSFSVTMKVSL